MQQYPWVVRKTPVSLAGLAPPFGLDELQALNWNGAGHGKVRARTMSWAEGLVENAEQVVRLKDPPSALLLIDEVALQGPAKNPKGGIFAA
jgi:hypothetical protein